MIIEEITLQEMWVIIILLGTLHGFWLSFVYTINSYGKDANKWLGGLMFIFSFCLTNYLLFATGLFIKVPHLLNVVCPMIYLVGPFFYFYIRTMVQPKTKLTAFDYLHFIPFMLSFITHGNLFFSNIEIKREIISNVISQGILLRWESLMISNTSYLVIGIYIIATILSLQRHARLSSLQKQIARLRQFQNYSYGFLTFIVLYIMLKITFYCVGLDPRGAEIVLAVTLTIFMHYTSYTTMYNTLEFTIINNKYNQVKYQSSPLHSKNLRVLKSDLIGVMKQNQLFLNPDLKLIDLSNAMNLPSAYISQLLNEEMKMNFYEFVNKFRVDLVKERLVDPDYHHYSLISIGIDCGFSNKTSFNRAFKKHTNMTPSQFKSVNAQKG